MTSAVVNAAMTASVGGVMEVEEDCCNRVVARVNKTTCDIVLKKYEA